MTIYVGPRIVSATGGIITTSGGFTIHTFSSSGTFVPKGSGLVDVLVVGGGGGGAVFSNWSGGGGGGGAVFYQKLLPVLSGVSYPFVVGPGGLGGATNGVASTCNYNGGSITAIGGGGGGPSGSPSGVAGNSVPTGSGGGGGSGPNAGSAGGLGAGVIGLGFPGGSAIANWGGGGGGAGGPGSPAPGATGGPGGAGVPYSITGSPIYYGGGGGGGAPATVGSLHPTSLPTTFGLGGTGGIQPTPSPPSILGNSGVVIVRYVS